MLNKYISSFIDGGLELKVYLNEEISRLKSIMKDAKGVDEIKDDNVLIESGEKVEQLLRTFAEAPIDDDMIEDVLKIQKLTAEMTSDEA